MGVFQRGDPQRKDGGNQSLSLMPGSEPDVLRSGAGNSLSLLLVNRGQRSGGPASLCPGTAGDQGQSWEHRRLPARAAETACPTRGQQCHSQPSPGTNRLGDSVVRTRKTLNFPTARAERLPSAARTGKEHVHAHAHTHASRTRR